MLGIAICFVGSSIALQAAIMATQGIIQAYIIGLGVFQSAKKTKIGWGAPPRSKIELFNESILMLSIYIIICFTPFIYEVETKFFIGYVNILIDIVHLLVNIAIIVKNTYLAIRHKLRLRA